MFENASCNCEVCCKLAGQLCATKSLDVFASFRALCLAINPTAGVVLVNWLLPVILRALTANQHTACRPVCVLADQCAEDRSERAKRPAWLFLQTSSGTIVTLCSCAINVDPHESRSHTCGKLVACFDAKRAEASAGGSWSDFCQQCKGSQ